MNLSKLRILLRNAKNDVGSWNGLADKIGVAPQTLHNIMNKDEAQPTITTIEQVAAYFRMKPKDLLYDEPISGQQETIDRPKLHADLDLILDRGGDAVNVIKYHIYEGDFLAHRTKTSFDFPQGAVIFRNGGFYANWLGSKCGGEKINERLMRHYEVIGNIYDNPELVEGK